MKAKVMIAFTDKHTGKAYKPGEVIEISAARFVEITSKGKYVQPVDDAKTAKAEKN